MSLVADNHIDRHSLQSVDMRPECLVASYQDTRLGPGRGKTNNIYTDTQAGKQERLRERKDRDRAERKTKKKTQMRNEHDKETMRLPGIR